MLVRSIFVGKKRKMVLPVWSSTLTVHNVMNI